MHPLETRKTARALEALGPIGPAALGLTAWEEAVRRLVLEHFPLLGRAPSVEELAAALASDHGDTALEDIRSALRRLDQRDVIYLDPRTGHIKAAYPFSNEPTRHTVRFLDRTEGPRVHAACAIDALGIPFMLRRPVSIASVCATCGQAVTIEVREGRIVNYEPEDTRVWVPLGRFTRAALSCCPTINFFCTGAHLDVSRRRRSAQTGEDLTLPEALALGSLLFGGHLRPAEPASPAPLLASRGPAGGVTTTTTSALSGVVAGSLASLCCLGPTVSTALGLGAGATGALAAAASALKSLLPYRPWFIGLAVVFVLLSFYLTYRPRADCRVPPRDRSACSTRAMSRALVWNAAATTAVLTLAPYWLGW